MRLIKGLALCLTGMCLVAVAGVPVLAADPPMAQPQSANDFIRALTPEAGSDVVTRGVTLGTGNGVPAPAPTAVVPAVAPTLPSAAPPPSKVVPAAQRVPVPPSAQPKAAPRISFQVTFAFNAATLSPEATAILDELGRALVSSELRSFRFQLVGHTDGVGSASYNLDLSRRRARAVQEYLVRNFQLPPGRVVAIGRGSEQLLDRANPANDANRRVEIINLGS